MRTVEELIQELELNREKSGLSVVEYCRFINISKSAYYRWLNGQPPKNYDSLKRINDYLNNI